ncbi:MAG: PilZ domain-containing protein [Acidobacteria bacterium]|nr:PilZ domain-containing protein [Acidobacteriota bacterium]
MAELLRELASRLRALVAERRRAPRLRLRLRCTVSLYETQAAAANRRAPSLEAYTRDLSASGIAIVTPAVRINDRYITASTLRLRLEHPSGHVELLASPVRYEQLPPESEETGYLVGVRIVEMGDADRARYEGYLSELK